MISSLAFWVIYVLCWTRLTTTALTAEEWQSGSTKCSPCFCSLTRPILAGGSLVKYVNCSDFYLDEIPSDLPEDTEFLDVSRELIQSVESPDVHYHGSSLMYPDLPKGFTNATKALHKLKYLDLTGNSFNEFSSLPFLNLEFLSGIFGLEIHRLSAEGMTGLGNLGILELRTPMERIPEDLFFHLKLSQLTLHLENAPTLPGAIFDPMKTSLKRLIIFGDKMDVLPETLLDNLLLLQKFRLIVNEMESIPEHLLHGSSLFRSLNLKKDIPDEMWILLHSMSSTRYLKDITLEGIKHLPKNVFQYIPYLEKIAVHNAEDLDPDLFKRLVRLNNLELADNNITDVKKEWFKDLGGLRTLNLSNNDIVETTQETFENLHSLEVFDLSGNELEQIERSVFDSFRSAIEELYLNKNSFSSLESDIFSEMWSLRELHLDNNNISEIAEPLFRDLHKLNILTMSNNEIENIEERSFENLQELRNLDLSDNNITVIPDGLFSNVISLQSVNISQNNLESVSSGMLSSHFWLKDLDAGTNPLHCDCALARLVDSQKHSIVAGKCSSPPKYEGVKIGELPTSAMCTEEELRRQEEEEQRRREEEARRKEEERKQREEELRRKATATTTTSPPPTTAAPTETSTTHSPTTKAPPATTTAAATTVTTSTPGRTSESEISTTPENPATPKSNLSEEPTTNSNLTDDKTANASSPQNITQLGSERSYNNTVKPDPNNGTEPSSVNNTVQPSSLNSTNRSTSDNNTAQNNSGDNTESKNKNNTAQTSGDNSDGQIKENENGEDKEDIGNDVESANSADGSNKTNNSKDTNKATNSKDKGNTDLNAEVSKQRETENEHKDQIRDTSSEDNDLQGENSIGAGENDVGQTFKENNKASNTSNPSMDSQKSSKTSWKNTPWIISVIVLVCVLLIIGTIFGAIKARGYLYRDDYNFNFSRDYIIDADEHTSLY